MSSLTLCSYTLPTGRLCGQPSLRGDSLCRFHIRSHAQAGHALAMDKLAHELEAMDLTRLLQTLNRKLDRISCYLRPYHEARLALIVACDRLAGITSMESMSGPQVMQNQPQPLNPNDLKKLVESLMESMN
jgi:hypothetical protein